MTDILIRKAAPGMGGTVYAIADYQMLEGDLVLARPDNLHDVTSQIESLVDRGAVGDGFHTMPELYDWRMVLQALLFNTWTADTKSGVRPVKSWRHSDGRYPFGDTRHEWFVVVAELPGYGQVSNHYRGAHWDLFDIPEVEKAPAFDGHTAQQALERLKGYLESTIEMPF